MYSLSDELLCSMAPQNQQPAVAEMRRILKPDGRAFLKATKGFMSYVDGAAWERILAGFKVEQRSDESSAGDRWAFVSNKLPQAGASHADAAHHPQDRDS
jgi:hypothetical protein